MANATTSLDYERAVRVIQEMQENIKTISQRTAAWVAEFSSAQEKCSKQVWMEDTISIGNGIMKQATDVVAILDDQLVALRKYHEQLQEFSNSGTGLDV